MDTERRGRTGRGLVVTAAIVDRHHRVLVIKRSCERWALPGGEVDAGESLGFRLRHHVRRATGFEVKAPSVVGVYAVDDALAIVVRCEISGVGSDITADTRSMRWMDRDAIRTELSAERGRGLLDALDTVPEPTVIDIADERVPELLAS